MNQFIKCIKIFIKGIKKITFYILVAVFCIVL